MRSNASRELVRQCLTRFEEIAKPGEIGDITFGTLNEYVNARLKMRGRNPGSTTAAATIRKELRTVHAALSFALKSLFVSAIPVFPKVDGFETTKRFVTPEHLDAMLGACHVAKFPDRIGFLAEHWWDAMLTLLWFAPNRIKSVLCLRWEDVDLDGGIVISKARNVKQKRTHKAHINDVVVERLQRIRPAEVPIHDPDKLRSSLVFPWPRSKKSLYSQFFAIQTAAGIKLTCDGEHEHTDACQFYGFDDFRRSFATLNDLKNLPTSFIQNQMGHSTYATTQRYIKQHDEHGKCVAQLASTPGLSRRQAISAGVQGACSAQAK
jgi:integrase